MEEIRFTHPRTNVVKRGLTLKINTCCYYYLVKSSSKFKPYSATQKQSITPIFSSHFCLKYCSACPLYYSPSFQHNFENSYIFILFHNSAHLAWNNGRTKYIWDPAPFASLLYNLSRQNSPLQRNIGVQLLKTSIENDKTIWLTDL